MKITEITNDKTADKFLSWCIVNAPEDVDYINQLEAELEKWVEEFDTLENYVKREETSKLNHYKMNRLTSLYFLIPVAISLLDQFKKSAPEVTTTFDDMNIRDNYSPEQQKLWDEDSLSIDDWDDE